MPICNPFPLLGALLLLAAAPLFASDHADPIRLPELPDFFDDGRPDADEARQLSGGITDFLFFPIKADGQAAVFPRKEGEDPALTPAEQAEIRAYVAILCVRRVLTKAPPVPLDDYTYRIHMDLTPGLRFDDPAERARYGGTVPAPAEIEADVVFEFQLNNDTSLKKHAIRNDRKALRNFEKIRVLNEKTLPGLAPEALRNVSEFKLFSGYRDDPFIFPPFFGANAVCMVMSIPAECFPEGQREWIAWATTSKGRKQFDHVGRSIRTQQPRFELLNKLHPSRHVTALREEERDPSFMRDVLLKLQIQDTWTLRPWDFVPDVMLYTNRFNAGYPNGRVLTDDVGALLARWGDTMIWELSYLRPTFPRANKNDKEFGVDFPYLAGPWPDSPPRRMHELSAKNKAIFGLILVGVIVIGVLAVLGVVFLVKKAVEKKRQPEQS